MRYTEHDLAIAILTVYQQNKPRAVNKYNALGGRGGSTGDFEYVLQTTFTSQERALAGKVLNDLQNRGLLEPTYADIISPGDWLVVTALGEQALQSGALDELDTLLLALHSTDNLLQLRYGSYDAAVSQRTDWQRHAATSCRELITRVLHTVAPDDQVRVDPHFKADATAANGITRKERIRHYLRQKDGSSSATRRAVIEKACDLVEACYAQLSAATHSNTKEVENLIRLTEEALYFLLS